MEYIILVTFKTNLINRERDVITNQRFAFIIVVIIKILNFPNFGKQSIAIMQYLLKYFKVEISYFYLVSLVKPSIIWR